MLGFGTWAIIFLIGMQLHTLTLKPLRISYVLAFISVGLMICLISMNKTSSSFILIKSVPVQLYLIYKLLASMYCQCLTGSAKLLVIFLKIRPDQNWQLKYLLLIWLY